MVPVSFLLLTTLNLPILDVANGIGTTTSAWLVLVDGSSTMLEPAARSQNTVKSGTAMELALLAIRDMTLSMVLVSSLSQTTPDPVMLDVVNGTGTHKIVYHAQDTGPSMPIEFVFLSAINVLQVMLMVAARPVTRDTV